MSKKITNKNTPQTAGTECEEMVSMTGKHSMSVEEFNKHLKKLPIVAVEDAKPEKIKLYNA